MTSGSEISPSLLDALLRRERIIITARLLTGVVHNLSGAVQMISLPLDLAQLALDKGEVQKIGERIGSVRHGLERLMGEVNLLAMRSLNDQRGAAETLDLSKLADEQLDFWRADLFFKHEVTLDRELPLSRERANASYVDVALALNSLLANAVDAVRDLAEPRVVVRGLQQDGYIGLEVSDNGPGPSEKMAAALFEPFAGDKGGAHQGLGLFLASKALEPWQGRVTWREGASDTTFAIELPVIKA
ncbi:MAG: hypothetical protein KQI62_12695 [Deltaproteobacteria bacterium]|nr:hypothetical protein [Deltaproteobacteria bacterium]